MNLRLVVWNCGMALHKKVEPLLSLRPSLAILAECAEPDIIRRKAPQFAFNDCEWSGLQSTKGLGVFSFGGLSLRRHQSWEKVFHLFLPLELRGPTDLNLLAVWAFNHRAPAQVSRKPRTTLEALQYYSPFLKAKASIVAGDFNANVIWDKTSKYPPFADVDAVLRGLGLTSAYHRTTGLALGEEAHGTLFWQKNRQQAYHIDYIYVPDAAIPGLRGLKVCSPDEWLALSDHVPLVMDLRVDSLLTTRRGAGESSGCS